MDGPKMGKFWELRKTVETTGLVFHGEFFEIHSKNQIRKVSITTNTLNPSKRKKQQKNNLFYP